LFVGDVAQIPNGKYTDPYYGDKHVSDVYLCEYTGDRMPDVLYGRMSATNVNNLMPQIDKLMYMENIPYEKTAFLDSSFLVAGIDNYGYGSSHLNPTIRYLHNLYYKDTASRYCSMYPYPNSAYASKKIISNINKGVSVGIYTAHGDWNKWSEPEVNNNDVEKFTNKDKYPFLIGNCCLTGKMDVASCFGETLLRKKDAGAVAYIGASNSSYFDEDVYWAVGYTNDLSWGDSYTYTNTGLGANDAFFHTHGEPYSQWALSAAEIMHAGNMAVEKSSAEDTMKRYYWQIYHVFGDPSYRPYNHRPEPISAVYAPWFRPETEVFEVATLPYAWVALSCEGENVAFAVADSLGRAALDVSDVTEACTLSLCISAQNALPLLKEIIVSDTAPSLFNEEGGATTQLSSLRLSIVRARAGQLQVAVSSLRGEAWGSLRVVNVLGSTVAVLDNRLRLGVETEEHTYEVGDLPAGLYLCTLTTPDGRITASKFVMR
ncbi:MAG: hypothetical protein K2K11_02260, partial [Bacteroidales bacterium]|nr:hypothetical protein [Bacteroidales bacterium]